MKARESDCVDCGMTCVGNSCPHKNRYVYYCDLCGCDMDDVYVVDGYDLCEDCLKQKFRKRDD